MALSEDAQTALGRLHGIVDPALLDPIRESVAWVESEIATLRERLAGAVEARAVLADEIRGLRRELTDAEAEIRRHHRDFAGNEEIAARGVEAMRVADRLMWALRFEPAYSVESYSAASKAWREWRGIDAVVSLPFNNDFEVFEAAVQQMVREAKGVES